MFPMGYWIYFMSVRSSLLISEYPHLVMDFHGLYWMILLVFLYSQPGWLPSGYVKIAIENDH